MALALIILAAGLGTRMKSDRPKVLHALAGAPLLHHAMAAAPALGADRIVVVAGHGAEAVAEAARAHSPGAVTVLQQPQLGTAHAVAQAREIAALVLSEINLQPDPAQDDPNDYFRLALDPPGLTRLPRGLWDRLQPWMDLSTRRMQQMLRVLQLPTPLLEQADVHNLPYRVLEAVLAAPAEARQGLIARAIEFEMTGEEVSDLVSEIPQPQQAERRAPVTRSAPVTRALRGLRGFSKACLALNSKNQGQALDEIANTVVVDGDAEEVLDLLESLMTRIRARTKRR